jgi:hypothetical protein
MAEQLDYMTETDMFMSKVRDYCNARGYYPSVFRDIYHNYTDGIVIQDHRPVPVDSMQSLDDLDSREKQREKDGFGKKVQTARIPAGRKIVVVPYAIEKKLILDPNIPGEDEEIPGSAEGDEGDVVYRRPIRSDGG